MTLGEKIKNARRSKKMTQQELCRDHLTRNMLSAIECGKASPSLSTLEYIASRLSIPTSYLVSDDDDLFFYEKKQAMKSITAAYKEKRYRDVIKLAEALSSLDNELAFILAQSHFALARKSVLSGALITAKDHITAAEEYCKQTVYETATIEHLILMYRALAQNIQSPLLEFDIKAFESGIDPDYEYEFYRYILSDSSFQYKNPTFSKHIRAKELIKNRKYHEALRLLEEIIDEKNPETYNCYAMFGVYTDMEYCSKQLANFEAAYKYASKRLSMIEGFKA